MITNVLQYIESAALKYPNKIAIADEKESVTYKELENRIKVIGSFMLVLGKKNSPVVVLMDKSVKCFETMFGVVASGNFYVIIDVHAPIERIHSIIDTLNPIAYIVSHDNERQLDLPIPKYIYEDMCRDGHGKINNVALEQVRRRAIDTDPVYALFTSGSTGVPKGAVINHKSVIAYAEWVAETFDIDEKVVFGNQTPFYFSMSVLELFTSIRSGAQLQIIPKKLFSFPVRLLEYMCERTVNTIYWVPSALCLVANWKALDYVRPSLKTILFAGEVMPTKQFNMWRRYFPDALFANLFGPTEITDIGTYYIVNREIDDTEPIPIGVPCRNTDVFLLDENEEEILDDRMGELYFRGTLLSPGYYNNPLKTEECFVQNPLNPYYPEIVYKTGDLVKRNEYGEFVYCGRKDFQIKHMGYRIELGEIENAVASLEVVENCVCLYDTQKKEIALFYTGKDAEDVIIIEGIKDKIPPYMYPGRLIKLPALKYNANGKIDRLTLQKEFLEVQNG